MNVRVLRSPALKRNPRVIERVRAPGEDNLAWIGRMLQEGLVEIGPNWSLLLLVGGDDPLSFRLRVSQSHVRHDLSPSAWSHVAFVPKLAPTLAESPVREISLAPASGFGAYGFAPPRNGLQDNRLGAYADALDYPNIAMLSAPVKAAEVGESLDALTAQRSILDAPQLTLRWLGYCWGVGVPASPLAEGFGMPGAAILEAAFAAKGFDLTPGLESRSSCPEAIWQAATWWHGFYERTADRKTAMKGAYSAKHDLVPDERFGGSPPPVTVPASPPAGGKRAPAKKR
jgi:hypothetical protein